MSPPFSLFLGPLPTDGPIGPSWSWAALDYDSGHIRRVYIEVFNRIKPLVNIIETHIEPPQDATGSPSGHLRSGYLTLSGRIQQMTMLGQISKFKWHLDPFNTYDLLPLGAPYEPILCLPIFVTSSDAKSTSRNDRYAYVYCLLLTQLQPGGGHKHSRIGLLEVPVRHGFDLDGEEVIREDDREIFPGYGACEW